MKSGGYLERRTPLRATGSLKRGEPMKRTRMRKASPRRIKARAHLRSYLAYVAQRPCAGELGIYIPERGPKWWRDHRCEGPIQVMHLGVKPGMGLKCSDLETGAGCMKLHAELDTASGVFRRVTKDERRAWKDRVIKQTQRDAVPEGRDQADDFASLGLGTVLHEVQGQGWAWLPLADENVSKQRSR